MDASKLLFDSPAGLLLATATSGFWRCSLFGPSGFPEIQNSKFKFFEK
jgi:hypothetical protein